MKKIIIKTVVFFIFLGLLVFFALFVFPKDVIVAEYQSIPIYLGDISVGRENILVLNSSRPPDSVVKLNEALRVKRKLRELVLEEAFQEYQIDDPEEEALAAPLSKKMKELYGTSVFTDFDANKQNETLSEMIKLIETWQNDNADGEQLFATSFANRISLRQWESVKKQYSTPDKLKELKDRIPHVDAEFVNEYIKGLVKKEEKIKSLKHILVKNGEIKEKSDFSSWIILKIKSAYIDPEYKPYIFPKEGVIAPR